MTDVNNEICFTCNQLLSLRLTTEMVPCGHKFHIGCQPKGKCTACDEGIQIPGVKTYLMCNCIKPCTCGVCLRSIGKVN